MYQRADQYKNIYYQYRDRAAGGVEQDIRYLRAASGGEKLDRFVEDRYRENPRPGIPKPLDTRPLTRPQNCELEADYGVFNGVGRFADVLQKKRFYRFGAADKDEDFFKKLPDASAERA